LLRFMFCPSGQFVVRAALRSPTRVLRPISR
jgi:hypothetical protein